MHAGGDDRIVDFLLNEDLQAPHDQSLWASQAIPSHADLGVRQRHEFLLSKMETTLLKDPPAAETPIDLKLPFNTQVSHWPPCRQASVHVVL